MSIQETVAELKRCVDIVDLISSWVALKRVGRAWGGLCPFHKDTKPSFYVWSDKGYYRCFGCGAAGDAISFMMAYHHMDFVEAVRELARRYGVEIKAAAGPRKKTKPLVEANKAAENFFHTYLQKNLHALEYLTHRGFTQRSIEEWRIGYAPEGDELLKFMRRQGIKEQTLLEAGLIIKRNNRLIPLLRNRVVFPIRDARGIVVGFGGRALNESQPKYINTPETLLFKKSEILFGLDRLKRGTKRLVVTEGYTDVIAAHQAGFKNFVGVLGTAFGEGHARLLRRYTEEVVLLFDADKAGRHAADRSIDHLLAVGISVRVGLLPEGMDVCDCILSEKEGILEEAIDGSVSFVRFLANCFVMDEVGKVKAAKRIGAALSVMDEPSKQVWAEEAARMLGVLPSALLSAARPRTITKTTTPTKTVPPEHRRDWDLIEAMIFEPELVEDVKAEFSVEDYRDKELGAVAAHIYTQMEEGRLSLEELYEEKPELRAKVAAVMERARQTGGPEKDYHRIVRAWAEKKKKRRLMETVKERVAQNDLNALREAVRIKKMNALGDKNDV